MTAKHSQRHAHARLQDRVAVDHTIAVTELRMVQRMKRGADKATRRLTRHLRVGIESDDVANCGQEVVIRVSDRKARVLRTRKDD
jgi:hypothetical protein